MNDTSILNSKYEYRNSKQIKIFQTLNKNSFVIERFGFRALVFEFILPYGSLTSQ